MEIINEILNLLRDLGVFGLAMWFIQMLLSKSADKKVERYKTELDQKTTVLASLYVQSAILNSPLTLYTKLIMKILIFL